MCLEEAFVCYFDDDCALCMEELPEDDDDTGCETIYTGCDGLWDIMCCTYTQGSAASVCADNEPLFDLVGECSNCEENMVFA